MKAFGRSGRCAKRSQRSSRTIRKSSSRTTSSSRNGIVIDCSNQSRSKGVRQRPPLHETHQDFQGATPPRHHDQGTLPARAALLRDPGLLLRDRKAPEEEAPEFQDLPTGLQFRFFRAVEHWRGNTHLTLTAIIMRAVEEGWRPRDRRLLPLGLAFPGSLAFLGTPAHAQRVFASPRWTTCWV